jgi:hypothetical protein
MNQKSAVVLGSLLVIGIVGSGLFSAIDAGSKRENIEFRMLTEDLADDELPFEGPYPVEYDNSAQVGQLSVQMDSQSITSDYTGCSQPITVSHPEATADVPSEVVKHWGTSLSWMDGNYEDSPTSYQVGSYKLEVNQNWGSWDPEWGMAECLGTMVNIEKNVDFNEISVNSSYPETVEQGETVTPQLTFENNWEPMTADYNLTYTTPGGLEKTESGEVSIPEGRTVVEPVEFTAETSGEVKFKLSGDLGLDTSSYILDGVSVKCSPGGERKAANECDMIQVAELDNNHIVQIEDVQTEEPPSFEDRDGDVENPEDRPEKEPVSFWENLSNWLNQLFGGVL